MYKIAAIAVALALFAVPAAIADHAEDESLAGTGAVTGELGIYIGSDGLWEETNEHAGLQTEVTIDEDEEEVPADDKLLP